MSKIFLFFFILIILSGAYLAHAALAPDLLVNDNLKKCQMYSSNSREEILEGWRYDTIRRLDQENWSVSASNYCNSLGYTLTTDEKVSELKLSYKLLHAGAYTLFLILLLLEYYFIARKRKRYILFFVLVIITYLVIINLILPSVGVLVDPCFSRVC